MHHYELQVIIHSVLISFIFVYKYIVASLFPFHSLIERLKEDEVIPGDSILSRLVTLERNVITAFPTNNNSNSVVPPFNGDIQQLKEQMIQNHLESVNKIEDLESENQILQTQINELKSQAEETQRRRETDDAHKRLRLMRNRIDILERYMKSDSQFESKKSQGQIAVQVLSQNTKELKDRVSTMEDQLYEAIKEFGDKKQEEVQPIKDKLETIKRYWDDLQTDLVKQNETIQTILSTEALSKLEKTMRTEMELCETKMAQVDSRYGIIEAEKEIMKEKFYRIEAFVSEQDKKLQNNYEDMRATAVSLAETAALSTSMDGRLLKDINTLKEHFTKMELQFKKVKSSITIEIDEVKYGIKLLRDNIAYVAEKVGISPKTLYPDSFAPSLPQNNRGSYLAGPSQSNLGNDAFINDDETF